MISSETILLVEFKKKIHPRPYVNTIIRRHHPFTLMDRLKAAEKAGWNVFQFPSEMLEGGDLLSDSGTTSISAEQFSALMLGDVAYGSNWGYFKLLETFEVIFGQNINKMEIYLFHQCRAAEHALFTQLPKHLKRRRKRLPRAILSNAFFDTTRANIEANGFIAMDIPPETTETEEGAFKGNISLAKLSEILSSGAYDIPLVYSTITNNTGGGQPVSLANLRATRDIAHSYNIPFFLDACRFAENAWFIKHREQDYSKKSIGKIVHEIFALCDGFTISFKKDGLSNMGGGLFLNKDSSFLDTFPDIVDNLRDHQILTEGHPTYGGISGRDIMVIATGLREVVQESYLDYRIAQVEEFGQGFLDNELPVVTPFGGHAIYIDVDKFFEDTRLERKDFGGISLTALLLLNGVRLCELGAFAFGIYNPKTKEEIFPLRNLVRAAVPRNKYEKRDLAHVVECVKNLHNRRDKIPRTEVVFGKSANLRHFKARFKLES